MDQNRQVIWIYFLSVRSSDLEIVSQDNNLLNTMIVDNPTTNYCRSVKYICIPMITRFDRLMFLFRDMEGNIMWFNGEFELQLTIEDVYDQVPFSILPMNQLSVIEVFGNTTKKDVKLNNPLLFDQISLSAVSLYTNFVLYNVPTEQMVAINAATSPQEVLIPRGAYDIETIITMLNARDAFPIRIGVSWWESFPYHLNSLLHDRFHECPWNPIDSQIQIECTCERTGQPHHYFLSTVYNHVVVTNGTTS